MPRKYRSPSPVKHKRHEYDSGNTRDFREKRYKSPSPVRRTRRYSPSPVRGSYRKNRKYYSDSESETSSESEYDSEDSELTDDSDYTSSEESSSESSSYESDEERTKTGRSVRRTSQSLERDLRDRRNTRENKSRRERKDTRENESRRESDKFVRNHREDKLESDNEKEYNNENKKSKKTQNEEDEELNTTNETGKKYSGPPRYLVLSIDGQFLEQKKIYTSNTGPKNAAQKAFNRLCTEMNKKMEITVKKDDAKGKIMTYSFIKEELNPPVEREIGGRKVIYRHKTVSC